MTDSRFDPEVDGPSVDLPQTAGAPAPPGEAVVDLTGAEPVIDARADGGRPARPPLERIHLFGLDLVNAATLEPVIDDVLAGPHPDGDIRPVVLTPNVDILVHLEELPDSVEADLFRRARYCLPDGQPLVIVSRLLGRPLLARLPGSGLFYDLWPRVVAERIPSLVVASSDQIADMLQREHPKASLVVPPFFDADDEDALSAVVDELLAAARAIPPMLVFVGIGNPKDARLIVRLLDRWDEGRLGPKPVCLGLGGSFSMYLGLKKRAPSWIQRAGLEWFYRFLQEPRRLFHRYFIRDLAFIGIVRRQWRATRSAR